MNLPTGMRKPTADELRAAAGRPIPDVIAPGLHVLFCGVNPGLYSAATGRHFARPGNRFWPALHMAGFTKRLLAAHENHEILEEGCGITSLVHRATATAREILPAELVTGGRRLARTVRIYRPSWVAVFGVGAYRIAFDQLSARVGPQQEMLAGAQVWLLPSPSGANGSYPLVDLIRELRTFHKAVDQPGPG
ncbi:MAG: G/U mismatch-specific DNA glycosylase [Gemmatimonadaceae bacterium]